MNLTVIGPTYPFRGGISHYTSLLVRNLRLRHQVQFISYSRQYPAWLYPGNNDRDPSRELLIHEPPDMTFDALAPWQWWRLPCQITTHQSQLIILPWSTVYWSPFYAIFLKSLHRVSGIPVAFICHNVLEHEASGLKSGVSRRVLGWGDFFLTHSRRDQANLLKWIGNNRAECVRVSPHPVYQHLRGPLIDKAAARAQLAVKSERVLLFFGFIREYKGLRYLLESLPLVQQHFPIHLLIAGEAWEGIGSYLKIIRELKLEESVSFNYQYIPNEQVSAYFAAADLVVIPYVSATQSGIVQLSFGFRKPVIVGNVGGLPEVVEDGQTGYLVPPRDPKAIAQAILDFYLAGRERDMVQRIESQLPRFSWERMVTTIEGLTGNLTGRAR